MKRKTIKVICLLVVMSLLCGIVLSACTKDTTKYTVTFDVNAGNDYVANAPDNITVESGNTVSEPEEDLTRRDYVFAGWYLNASGTGDKYDFSTPVTSALKLYAKWDRAVTQYTVSFYLCGGGDDFTQTISENSTANEVSPTRDGYAFGGWYLENSYVTLFDFNSKITANTSLYAKWSLKLKVDFDLNYDDNEIYVTQTVLENEFAVRPEVNPQRDGYSFSGWYTERGETGIVFSFTTAITENTSIYAKWTKSTGKKYTVTFNYNYPDAPQNEIQEIDDGGVVSSPQTPTRDGYRIEGWYTDSKLENKFSLDAQVTSNLDLYANWVKVYILTVDYNYEGAPKAQNIEVDEGKSALQPVSPSRPGGYTFSKWTEGVKNGDFDFKTVLTENTIIYAQWDYQYVFEAEDTDLSEFRGAGTSGPFSGTSAICDDLDGSAGASNGRYINYANKNGVTLTFEIYSDRAVTDASIILRLSAYASDAKIVATGTDPQNEPIYTVKLNDETVNYGSITFTGVPAWDSGYVKSFWDYDMKISANLAEGKNTIKLITDNNVLMYGTMSSTAPMIDCIKITTYAELNWTKQAGNY